MRSALAHKQIPVRHLDAASCLLIAESHCKHSLSASPFSFLCLLSPAFATSSSRCTCDLLVDIPIEFQFPVYVQNVKRDTEKAGKHKQLSRFRFNLMPFCFAQESMLRFLVHSIDALGI